VEKDGKHLEVKDRDISFHCKDFVQLVLQSRRFTCADGLAGRQNRDCSSCFVYLKSGQWCRVDSGVQLVFNARVARNQLKQIPMCFLRVVKYPVLINAVLGKNLTVLDGNEETLPDSELISVEDVVCTGLACPKPLNNTAELHEHQRLVVPSLYL